MQERYDMTEKLFDFLEWVDDNYGPPALVIAVLTFSCTFVAALGVLAWATNGYIFLLLPLFVVYLVYKYNTRNKE